MKKIISFTLFASLGLAILFTACRKDADTTVIPETPKEEITTETEKDAVEPFILDDSNWVELAPNVYVTPEYYDTPLNENNSRFYGNCPSCQSGCTCPWGWNCNDGDCISSPQDNGTAYWVAGGDVVTNQQNSFMHVRYARCWKRWGVCFSDKDNRFYFAYKSWMGTAPYTKLRVMWNGTKSSWCSDDPAIDRLTVNGYQYMRVTTGQYCPTNNVRLARIR